MDEGNLEHNMTHTGRQESSQKGRSIMVAMTGVGEEVVDDGEGVILG